MTVAAELERIYQRDGALLPEAVVEEAADVESALHEHFEWDDTAAGQLWRLEQARRLIRGVQIDVQVEPERTVRARRFVNLPEEGYVATADALRDPGRRDVVMQQAMRDAQAFRRKYEGLVDVEAVWAASKGRRRKRVRAA